MINKLKPSGSVGDGNLIKGAQIYIAKHVKVIPMMATLALFILAFII